MRRLTLAATLLLTCTLATAQTSTLPTEPIADTYPVLSDDVLTHVYSQSWYQDISYLDLEADTVGLCDYDGGRLCITKAWLHTVGNGYPTSYSDKFSVRVSLAVYYPSGDITELKHSSTREEFIYCKSCGGIRRNRPTITLNGSTEEEITITYGESITVKSNNTATFKYNGVSHNRQGAAYFYLDGERGNNGDVPGVGTHTVLAVSLLNGNNVFKPKDQASNGWNSVVVVGYEYAEKTFTLTVTANPIALTFSQRLSIASRPADDTANLGKLTLPEPDKLNAQGVSPGTAIAEIDSSAVAPEPGTYTVRYRLTTTNPDYYTVDSSIWYETTFTITEPVTPLPSTHPDFFGSPLINQGDVLGQDLLSHVYAYQWYTGGGQVSLDSPIELATVDDGKVLISKVFIGNSTTYPTSYSDALPVYVKLSYVNADGDTLDIAGRYEYCSGCGTITRQTPAITLNGSEDDTVVISQGEALNAQTSATGGSVTVFVDGTETANGSTPTTGTHTVRIVSAETGNNIFAPEDQADVGFEEAEKTFTLTVTLDPITLTFTQLLTIASRPADGTANLGKLTLPTPDNAIEGVTPPEVTIAEIDSSAVDPEPGTYAVRYRLAIAENDYYTVDSDTWYETTFTITAATPTPDPDPDPDPEPDPEPGIDPTTLTEPLIDYGDVLSQDLLTHDYVHSWYISGGQVDLSSPVALTTLDGTEVLISKVFIGYTGDGVSHNAITSYDAKLPVYVELSYVNSNGDTLAIDGRYKYCGECGSVKRHTPVITLNGSEGPDVTIEYGEALNAQTSAKVSFTYNGLPVIKYGGCEIYMDGETAYNFTVPSVGTHTVIVISKLLEPDTKSKKSVLEGYARTEKTFNLTVTGEGPCVDGIVRLKFGNTLIVDNSADEYTAYQWTADGTEIAGATKQYYHSNPLPQASYVVTLTKVDGSVVTSCPFEIGGADATALSLRVVSESGGEVVVAVGGAAGESVSIVAYTAGGVLVAHGVADSDGMARLVLPRGVNVVRAMSGQRSAEVRVVCK